MTLSDHGLTGAAKLAGVLGWPVAHSLSPRLHGYWLRHHHVDGAYVPLPVPPERLDQAIRALPVLGFAGANLTIPHKENVLSLLQSVSETARRIGAVNTLIINGQGDIHGHNTDAEGFMASVTDAIGDVAPGRVIILGAGGAARAVAVALLEAGYSTLILCNRTVERSRALADHLRSFGADAQVQPWPPAPEALARADFLINTTSLGMRGQPDLDLDLQSLPDHAIVSDIVYTPLETTLLRHAKMRGLRTVDGLGMLLHQARAGFAAWFGVAPAVTPELRTHMLAAFKEA